MKKYFLFFLCICHICFAREISCPLVMDYIESQLPHCGVLKREGDFVYVDVDDDYVHQLIGLIGGNDFQEPPYFGEPGLVGAHISVIYSEEACNREISECGQMIHFTPKGCEIVQPAKWGEMKEVYLIFVDAPELDKLREKYGLPKREYPFHITIGVKPY